MAKGKKTIDQVGEFGFIRSIMKGTVNVPDNVIRGIGDDCAVIAPDAGKVLLITTDLLLEGIHFLSGKISYWELGAKAVAVNLSDIAAMGGVPRHLFVSMAIPRGMPMDDLNGLYAGMKEKCGKYGVNLLGGDTSASPGGLFLNVTVIGEADGATVLYRKGASPGDRVYVTGTLGDAEAGLRLLKGDLTGSDEIGKRLIAAHNRPEPQLAAGRLIAESMLASAMIDLSDGLVSDLGQVCRESRVGACIFAEHLPLSEALKAVCSANTLDPLEFALSGGEDYELLFTVPRNNADSLEKHLEEEGHAFFRVGEIINGKGVHLVSPEGTERAITRSGFDHFAPVAQPRRKA
jgi:thiamine-monophosphate kinase